MKKPLPSTKKNPLQMVGDSVQFWICKEDLRGLKNPKGHQIISTLRFTKAVRSLPVSKP
ncbi:MAG: hypothetical protein RL403_29 [Bacteroidota bacterium]